MGARKDRLLLGLGKMLALSKLGSSMTRNPVVRAKIKMPASGQDGGLR
jgi:hypothetical protein